jgi:hypothetical protein
MLSCQKSKLTKAKNRNAIRDNNNGKEKGIMIRQSVKLNFDPGASNPEIQNVFADDLARILWLAIKQGHLTDQNFCGNVLRCAAEIKQAEGKGMLDAKRLFFILSGATKSPGCGIIGPSELSFADEIMPFVTGEKSINFEVRMG